MRILFNETIVNYKKQYSTLSNKELNELYQSLPEYALFQKYAIVDLFFDRESLLKVHIDWVIRKSDFLVFLCEPSEAACLLFHRMMICEHIEEEALFKFLHIHHRMKWNLTAIDLLKTLDIDKVKKAIFSRQRSINLLKLILTESYDIETFLSYFDVEYPQSEFIQEIDNLLLGKNFYQQCNLIQQLMIREDDGACVDCAIYRSFLKGNRLTEFLLLSIWDGKNRKYKNDIRSCGMAKWIFDNKGVLDLSPDLCVRASHYLMESTCLTSNFESYQLLLWAVKHNITNEELYNRYLTLSSFGQSELPNYTNFNDICFSHYNLLRFATRNISLLQWSGNFSQAYRELGNLVEYNRNLSTYPIPRLKAQKTKIKVALEISGQIRISENELNQNIQILLDQLKNNKSIEVDIYLSSWQQTVLKKANSVRRLFGNKLFYLLPSEFRAMHSFAKLFPNTNRKLLNDDILFTPNTRILSQFCKAIHLEQEEEFVHSYLSDDSELKLFANQAKMFYKIYNCHLLSSMHGTYDVCIRMRSDVQMRVANLEECIYMAYRQKNIVFTTYTTREGMGDQFAVLSKQAMDVYADVWAKISTSQSFQYNDLIEPNIGNEHLLLLHCRLAGLEVHIIPTLLRRLNSMMFADYFDLSEYLKKDLEQDYSKEKELFVQTYIDMKKNGEPFEFI